MRHLATTLCLAILVAAQPAIAEGPTDSLKFRSMVDGQFIPAVATDRDDVRLFLAQTTTEGETAADQAGAAAESAADAAGDAADAAAEAVDKAAEAAAAAPQTMEEKLESLRSEMRALVEQSQANAESMVDKISSGTALSENQVYGIGVGIVVGALAADLMGFGGLATLAVSASGGLLGNWVMSEESNGMGHDPSPSEDLDDLAEELPDDTSAMSPDGDAKGEMSL